jgi:putative protease
MKKKKKAAKARPKPKAKARKVAKARVKKGSKPAKRKAPKAAAAKRARKPREQAPKPTIIAPPNSVELGRVEDYYAHIGVIALTLRGDLRLGDHLHILGHTTNLEQPVESMQIDHQAVSEAHPNDAVGIKVTARVRRGDHVFLIKG